MWIPGSQKMTKDHHTCNSGPAALNWISTQQPMGGFIEGNGKTNLRMHFDKEKHLCAWNPCERKYKGMLVDEDGTYSCSTEVLYQDRQFPLF